jgi:ssDNA thymidine ADP-ribosyltransferase, DarT
LANLYPSLNPKKALIWRVVHRDNLSWILDNGLHCRNSTIQDPNYVNIGSVDLIDKRANRRVPIEPSGTLSDYVPFYFTPFSVMMRNIHTGWGGITQRPNEEIVILVSSLHRVKEMAIPFVFTDSHAYPPETGYFNDLTDLANIDWGILQARDFKRDVDDPQKMSRYQAEALVYRHLPIAGLLGIVCHTETLKSNIEVQLQARDLTLPVHARRGWYF